MRMRLRVALLAGAGAAALALGGSALAAYTPRLVVSHTPLTLSGGGTTDLTISFGQNDDATARASIYVPQGYTGTFGAPGAQVGTVDASVLAKLISPDQPIPLKGTIRSDDPAKYVANPCSPGTHEAVWLLVLEAAGQTLNVPMYLDTVTAPAEAPLGKYKLVVCLPSPDIPPSAGGATFGSKLISATLHLTSVFTLPVQNGSYPWLVIATPYVPGTATPNPAGTVQAQGVVRLPAGISLKRTGTRVVRLSGLLRVNRAGVAGVRVTLYAGTSRTRLRAVGSRTTGASGAFSFRRRVARTTYFQVRAAAPARSASCTGGVPNAPCSSATLNAFSVRSAIVRVRR